MKLTDISAPKYAHVVGWFGQANHWDVGYDSTDKTIIRAQLSAIRSLGIDGVNILWSGLTGDAGHVWSTRTATNWMRVCEDTSTPFFLMIDHLDAFSIPSIQMLMEFFSSPMYQLFNNKPLLTCFDPMTDAQLAAMPSPASLVFRNAGGLTAKGSSGAFEWPAPPQTSQYIDYFRKTVVNVDRTKQLIINHVCPRFRGASWNVPGMVIPSRNGQEWQDSLARVPSDSQMLMIATWNDWEEGSNLEGTYLS